MKAGELVTGEVIEVLGERLTVTGPGRAEHRGDRHSAANHLGEASTDATVIMTKGHWQSIRTAARYTRPGLHAITPLRKR